MFFRKRGHHEEEEGINTNGWMMSYADMATTLLAMFIVLSTLGKDQTGISLYNGTGSYINATNNFGVPGFFANSRQLISKDFPGPHYTVAADGDGNTATNGNARVIDAEQEEFNRFFSELERHFPVQHLPHLDGQAAVDFYDRLGKAAPFLTARQHDVIWQILPLLHNPDYQVRIIVWATMPSTAAWNQAASRAQQVVDEIGAGANLDSESRSRLWPIGQPWRYPNYQRPTLSVVVVKTGVPTRKNRNNP